MIHLVNAQVANENIIIGLAISFAFVSLLLVNMGEVKQTSAESIWQTVGLTVCLLLNLLLAGVVLHDKFYTEPGMQREIDSLKLVRFITRAHRAQVSVNKLYRGKLSWLDFFIDLGFASTTLTCSNTTLPGNKVAGYSIYCVTKLTAMIIQ